MIKAITNRLTRQETTSGKWLDQNFGLRVENRLLRSMLIIITICFVLTTILTIYFGHRVIDGINSQRLVLVPAIQRKMTIPAEAHISDSYIKAVSKRVVELVEQWSYSTIEDNYKELFSDYYSHSLMELTNANLRASNYFERVIKNEMVSTFQFDWERSEFKWCEELNVACSLIVGKRRLYVKNNVSFSEKEVAYLILSDGIYPDDNNPFAVRIKRLKVDDSSQNPYVTMKAVFDSAMKGDLPDA